MKKLACLLTTALMLTVCTGVFAAQPAAGTVLNSNPAFDDGIDGWTKNGGGGTTLSSDTGGLDGTKCCKVAVTNNTSSYDSASPKQTVTVTTGKTYTITAWLKYPAKANEGTYTFNHAIRADMGSGNTIALTYADGTKSAAGRYPYAVKTTEVSGTDWVKLEQTFTIDEIKNGTAKVDSASIAFYINREKGGDYDSERVSFWVDDFYIIERQAEQTVDLAVSITGQGTVSADGQPLANDSKITVASGSDKTFTLQPGEGWQIGTVSAGGNTLTPDGNGTVTVKNITEAFTLNVSFIEKTVQEPSFSGASQLFEGIYTPADEPAAQYYSSTVFSAINPGYGWEIVTFGMEVYEEGSATPLPLAVELRDTDGKYGVRVYGPALETGKTYVMRPYMQIKNKTDNTEKTVYGTAKTFTVSE